MIGGNSFYQTDVSGARPGPKARLPGVIIPRNAGQNEVRIKTGEI
jgi:hypothetical protein